MNKPELNDEFAKTKIRKYKTFGGNTVEIMYGAQDENGKAVSPKEGVEDGHGTWSGIEVKGDYRMFVWTHSKAEGGATEYGTEYKENALDIMKQQLEQKIELARKLEAMIQEGSSDETALNEIKEAWNALTVWDVPAEKDTINRYEKALASYEPKLQEIQQNITAKSEIAAQADQLLDAQNFRNARNELDKLKDSMLELGTAGREKDDEFFDHLRSIDHTLREKQKEYNEHANEIRGEAETKKKEIIAKTKDLVEHATNFKETNEKINALFDEWKVSGNAGKDTDDALWEEFSGLRRQFFDARAKYFDERNQQFKKSAETKQKLIEEVKEIASKKDYGRNATQRMKQCDIEWRKAGFSGQDQNDALWDTFTKAKEEFWSAKKEIFTNAVEADLAKAQTELEKISKEIEDLEYRLTVVPNPAMQKDVEDMLYVKKDEKTDKENEIADLKKKASE